MGRRSRKREATGTDAGRSIAEGPPPARARPPVPVGRRPRREEAPAAPWSPFPLVELCILVGIVLMIVGVLTHGSRGRLIVALGVALVSLSALELSLREHFAGYRSHTTLLAGACTVGAEVLLFFVLGPPPIVMAAVAVAVFVSTWTLLRGAFRRRTGGLGWRA